jgi:hypothetical protein
VVLFFRFMTTGDITAPSDIACGHDFKKEHRPRHGAGVTRGAEKNCAVPPVSPYQRNRAEFVRGQRPWAHTPAARWSAAATSSEPSRTAFPRSIKMSLSAFAA